jgi:hypothetical protein
MFRDPAKGDFRLKPGSPALKLLFDVYHVQIMDGDLISRSCSYPLQRRPRPIRAPTRPSEPYLPTLVLEPEKTRRTCRAPTPTTKTNPIGKIETTTVSPKTRRRNDETIISPSSFPLGGERWDVT